MPHPTAYGRISGEQFKRGFACLTNWWASCSAFCRKLGKGILPLHLSYEHKRYTIVSVQLNFVVFEAGHLMELAQVKEFQHRRM